jgi:diadenosine tetraphosphatase ApaH/serine/threonine PP2A family protein phosphatase
VTDHTTNPVVRKTGKDLLLRWLSAIGSKIFRTDDCRARDEGWQIIPRHGGLSRTYRDARFDYLISCAACDGRGCNPRGATCSGCHGTGRIVLDPAAVSRPERGQQ